MESHISCVYEFHEMSEFFFFHEIKRDRITSFMKFLFYSQSWTYPRGVHQGSVFRCCMVGMYKSYYDAPKSKPDLPSAAQTRNSTGLKIYTCIVLTLAGDQKVFSQPSHYWNFLYQGFYPLQPKLPAAQFWKFACI